MLAQPRPFRGRERCNRPAAYPVGQPLGADRLRECRRLWRGARVVPEHCRAQRILILSEDDESVLLAADRECRDLTASTGLREGRSERFPPFARVGFARPALATDRVPGAAAGDDASRLRIDHQHFRRLGRRIDACNERGHATSVESARREATRPPANARLHQVRLMPASGGGNRARSLRQRTLVAGYPPAAARPRRDVYAGALSPGAPLTSASRRPPKTPRLGAVPCPEAAIADTRRRDRRPGTDDQDALLPWSFGWERHIDVSASSETRCHSERGLHVRHDGPS